MATATNPEFLLYGIPKGETERYTESLLAVRATLASAESVKAIAAKDGFHSFRIAGFNGDAPDFIAAISK